jgi:type I restriction enzyme R subunit
VATDGRWVFSQPLSTRLFKARLQVIEGLDDRLTSGDAVQEPPPSRIGQFTETQLREDTAKLLRDRVVAMNPDNFVVRPQRQFVEKYARPEAWEKLDSEAHNELATKVAPLPSELGDEDEEAKRFDLLLLRTQLAILQARPDFDSLKEKIQAIAGSLEEQEAIPAVKAEMVLIQSVVSEEWWEGVTLPMLEVVRRRLRLLIKLIPKARKKIVYTDFEDELGEGDTIDLPQVTAGLDMARFRDKARQFLRAHESHLALQRLRRNQPLTATDLDELERMLMEAGGTAELITKAKEASHGLGLFIRSLVGLDRETAMELFSDFIKGTTATPNQIEFIDLIVQELTQTGVMEPDRLFQSHFTDLSAQGPFGIFPQERVAQLVQVLEEIKGRAVA